MSYSAGSFRKAYSCNRLRSAVYDPATVGAHRSLVLVRPPVSGTAERMGAPNTGQR